MNPPTATATSLPRILGGLGGPPAQQVGRALLYSSPPVQQVAALSVKTSDTVLFGSAGYRVRGIRAHRYLHDESRS